MFAEPNVQLQRVSRKLTAVIAGTLLAATLASGSALRAETISVSELKKHTHIHGLAVDRTDPSRLLIATHHGLLRAAPDGTAERISVVQDFMGFTPHPTDAAHLLASGHPATGGNLGFIASRDNGATWEQVSPGADGPVDFHQMTISAADPAVIYGAYRELQVSRDGGKSWANVAPLPEKLIDLAASQNDAPTLYAATETGLLVSRDGGVTWEPLLPGAPVSLVETAGGKLYAFVVGQGLMQASEESLDFTAVGSGLQNYVLLHFAVDPANPGRMFAASHRGDILESADGGLTWKQMGS